MSVVDRLKRPTSDQEEYLYLSSQNLGEDLDYIKTNRIENLMLIPNSDGFHLDNIDFLQEIPFVKRLQMGSCSQVKHYEGLASLENLELLSFSSNEKMPVDLSLLQNLSHLDFSYSRQIKGLDRLSNLTSIGVGNGTDEYFRIEVFRNYSKLSRLVIGRSILNQGLAFLKANSSLENLDFTHMKRGFDLEGIQYLRDSLKRLRIMSSKKVDNIQLISELHNLEWLILSDSVPLESSRVLEPLRNLEALTLRGSSYFIDGDLRALEKRRESIKYYNIAHKSHYLYI